MNPAPLTAGEPPAGATRAARAKGIRILPQTDAQMPAVLAFNRRMLSGGAPTDFVLPDRPNQSWAGPGEPAVTWTKYVAVDEADEVRGGFLLMRQRGWLNGEEVPVANYQAPVSEGILDKRYGMVGMHMLRHLEREFPLAFVVGMGAMDRPLPRLLSAAGWKVRRVPFLFRIVRPARVLRELRPLQQRPWLRVAARTAARSGAGWIAAQILHARQWLASTPRAEMARLTSWGEWADQVWERVRNGCSFAVVRDGATLERLYPLDEERYAAYVFRAGALVVGWAVCARTAMRDHVYFGNLKVATILDAMADSRFATSVVSQLSRELDGWADLIITNQSSRPWVEAFRRTGFIAAPSNYLLAASRKLAAGIGDGADRVHVTRGDGDGRIHLI